MSNRSFSFEGELWEYGGEATWFFVTVPEEISDEIDEVAPQKGGFGSVRVTVRSGSTTWLTSVFPDKASGCFVLPIKKKVRDVERVQPGDIMTIELTPQL